MKFKRKLSEVLYIKRIMPRFKYARNISGNGTFQLNFSGGFGAFSDVWDGVFDNSSWLLMFTLPPYGY